MTATITVAWATGINRASAPMETKPAPNPVTPVTNPAANRTPVRTRRFTICYPLRLLSSRAFWF